MLKNIKCILIYAKRIYLYIWERGHEIYVNQLSAWMILIWLINDGDLHFMLNTTIHSVDEPIEARTHIEQQQQQKWHDFTTYARNRYHVNFLIKIFRSMKYEFCIQFLLREYLPSMGWKLHWILRSVSRKLVSIQRRLVLSNIFAR